MTPQLHIKYPVVQGLKEKGVQGKINNIIYAAVFKLRDENASALKKHQKDHSYYVQSEVVHTRNEVLSIKFDESLSIPYYAHPFNALYAVTVNTNDGSVYKLKDLFKPGITWEAALNNLLKENIDAWATKEGIALLKQFKGIDKEQEFYLTNGSLVIFWQEAVYLPRYLGPLMVKVPYRKLEGISWKIK